MTFHNEAKKEDIAKIVIMPGDPLRAKFIAENFLENYRLVNTVRNMYAYTGTYKGKEITVMASGMGMPSMGIYAYELYTAYDVDTIIRVGSCGIYRPVVNLLSTLIVEGSYTKGNFALNFDGEDEHFVKADRELNEKLKLSADALNIPMWSANIACVECFDMYVKDPIKFYESFPKEYNIVGSEMESFSLLYTAKKLGKKAACMLTVVDSITDRKSLSSEDRRSKLKDMVKIALESL